MLAITVSCQVVAHQLFGFFKPDARFLDDQLMNLHQVGGRQAAFFVRRRLDVADHAGQRGFHIKQRRGHVHQHRVGRLTLALGDALHHHQLIDDDLTRLTKPQYRQGIGDLAQRCHQAAQLRDM